MRIKEWGLMVQNLDRIMSAICYCTMLQITGSSPYVDFSEPGLMTVRLIEFRDLADLMKVDTHREDGWH